ncbi:MAG: hypothetical protein AAGA37_15445, partial [Actinomycetota bacterium]
MNRTLTSRSNLSKGLVAASVLGGAAVGASFVGTAGAYGDLEDQPAETQDTSIDTQDTGQNVQVQDAETPDDADTPDEDGSEGDRRGRRGGGGCNLEEVAAAIGIDEDALRTELQGGQSIADVAEANGV